MGVDFYSCSNCGRVAHSDCFEYCGTHGYICEDCVVGAIGPESYNDDGELIEEQCVMCIEKRKKKEERKRKNEENRRTEIVSVGGVYVTTRFGKRVEVEIKKIL